MSQKNAQKRGNRAQKDVSENISCKFEKFHWKFLLFDLSPKRKKYRNIQGVGGIYIHH
jgi:hypothetical protein